MLLAGYPGQPKEIRLRPALSDVTRQPDNERVIDIEPGRFEEMVATALDSLPAELGRLMSNVAVTV